MIQVKQSLIQFFLKLMVNLFLLIIWDLNKIPKTKMVRGSNQCKISFFKRDKKLIILSTIDNLVKGAAGQAIQNMNIMFDYQEDSGLNLLPLAP